MMLSVHWNFQVSAFLGLPLALACSGKISGTYTQGMQFTEALRPRSMILSTARYRRTDSPKYQHVREQERHTCRCCSMLQTLAILRPREAEQH